MDYLPHEFTIGGVYLPPLLIASILGALAAVVTAALLTAPDYRGFSTIRRSSLLRWPLSTQG
jgi:hypothetical protein